VYIDEIEGQWQLLHKVKKKWLDSIATTAFVKSNKCYKKPCRTGAYSVLNKQQHCSILLKVCDRRNIGPQKPGQIYQNQPHIKYKMVRWEDSEIITSTTLPKFGV